MHIIGIHIFLTVLSVFVILFVSSLIFFLKNIGSRDKPLRRLSFYRLCRSKGITLTETRFLDDVLHLIKYENILSLFKSNLSIDEVVDKYLIYLDKNHLPIVAREIRISKLMNIRRKFQMVNSSYRKTDTNSLSIQVGQRLRLSVLDKGFYGAEVIDNHPGYLIISFPEGEAAKDIDWTKRSLGVYYWRENDAGYFFETRVLQEIRSESLNSLFIAHSQNVQRKQSRSFLRVAVDIPVELLFIKTGLDVEDDSQKKVTGKIVNLSSDGLLIESSEEFVGSYLYKVNFSLPGGNVETIIKLVAKLGCGENNNLCKYSFQFTNLSMEIQTILQLFVYRFHDKPSGLEYIKH